MTTHLYLIRHAENIDAMQDGRMQDQGLSPEGIAQAEKLRDRLARTGEIKPDILISSDERRALETANILAPALGVPVTPDPEFQEWRSDDGSIHPDEFMRRWKEVPKSQKAYYRWIPGFESRIELSLRVHLALNRVLSEHTGKTLVIVTHGAFMQMSFNYFFGMGEANLEFSIPEVRRTSITHWYRGADETRWTLERSNDYHHLTS